MGKIPFDEGRFMLGAIALCGNVEVKCLGCIDFDSFAVEFEKGTRAVYSKEQIREDGWTMKPVALDDGWIPHSGGECPIPWAKAGEFERKFSNGNIAVSRLDADHIGCSWTNPNGFRIIAYRLTDGWIPVFGECRFSEGVRVDIRLNDGRIHLNVPAIQGMDSRQKLEGKKYIVAVRLVKLTQDNLTRYIQKQMKRVAESVDMGEQSNEQKTSQQRLNREAYTRYKAAHPEPVKAPQSVGDIEGLILAAMMAGK